ncbi:chaperonin GroEL [Candidatus Vidania fulgoroideorum]
MKKIYNKNVLKKIIKGIKILYKTVRLTLGPEGKNVIIEKKFSFPIVTKDGITVSKEVELKSKIENLGVKLVNEAASKTNDDAGDGTTTATILSYKIIKEGYKYICLGFNANFIVKEINKFLNIAIKRINKKSKKIKKKKEITNVGSISSNNDKKIGKIISKAISIVGKDGTITLEDGKYINDELEIVEGLSFNKGYISHYFLNNEKSIILENSYVLIYNRKLSNINEILPLLEKITRKGYPLLMILEDIDNDILNTIIINNARGVLKTVIVKAPSFGENKKNILEDIAYLTGTNVFGEDYKKKIKKISINDLGIAKKVDVTKNLTKIIGGKASKKKIKLRIDFLKENLKNCDNEYDKEKINERISKLSKGIAVIKVGGTTDIEVKERRYRIEDALNATKAALEEGIVPGGGIALLRTAEWMEKNVKKNKKNIAFNILIKTMKYPFKRIIKNSDINYKKIFSKISNKKFSYGYDVKKRKFCNLVKNGVIDPSKVVKTSIINAVSIASLILMSSGVITENFKNQLN